MSWKSRKYRLQQSAPLIMHNGQTADPLNPWAKKIKLITGKRNKTEEDHIEIARLKFLSGLYMGENGPVIPAANLEGMIINAAKKSKEGLIAKSGMYVPAHAELIYDGPKTAEELWDIEKYRFTVAVVVSNSRVMTTRPIFTDWSSIVEVCYEDTLANPEQVDKWLQVGGTQIGLCDWRPRYGRFTVSLA